MIFFSKQKEEEKLAYQVANKALKELVYKLHVDENLVYLPEIKVREIKGKVAGRYNPDKHEISFQKNYRGIFRKSGKT